MKETATCKNCGEKFEYERKKKAKIYCSKKCAYQYYNRNCRDKEHERLRQARLREDSPEKAILYRITSSANNSNRACDIDEQWILSRLARGTCEATGLPLVFKAYKPGDKGVRSFFAPSIDRIDNNGDYIKSNIRLVCWGYNLVKNSFTDREVVAMSLGTILQAVPSQLHQQIINLLPKAVISTLPSNNPFVSEDGRTALSQGN